MNTSEKTTPISSVGLFSLIVMSAMFGLSLSASKLFRTDFIPTQFAIFLLCLISLILTVFTFTKGGYRDITECADQCFTRFGSAIILAAFGIYFIVQAALGVYTQTEMIKLYLLTKTPDDIIIISLVLTAAFLFYTGLRQLAGTAQLLFFIVSPLILLLLLFALYRCDLNEVKVLAETTSPKDLRSLISGTCALWGIESAIFFLGAKRYNKKIGRAVILGYITVFFLFIVSFTVTVGTFSLEGSANILFPLSEMSRILNIGGLAVTERFDVLFLFIQIIGTVIKTAIAMYCSAVGLSSVFNLKNHRCFTMLLLPAVVLIAYICSITKLSRQLSDICSVGFAVIMFVIVPLITLITLIKHNRKGT